MLFDSPSQVPVEDEVHHLSTATSAAVATYILTLRCMHNTAEFDWALSEMVAKSFVTKLSARGG